MECLTYVEKCRTEYIWTIDKFSNYLEFYNKLETPICIKSGKFVTEMNNEMIEWNFELQFNESKSEYNDWISIYLFRLSPGEKKINVLFHLGILNSKKEELNFGSAFRGEFNDNSLGYGKDKFLQKEMLIKNSRELLPNDCLTIICNLVTFDEPVTVSRYIKNKETKYDEFIDYKKLLSDPALSDVTFIVGDKEMKAHKAVLLARSPKFAAMVAEKILDSAEKNHVHITDIKVNVMEALLKFIYTNEVDNIDGIVNDLLDLADKYKIKDLKEICEETLYLSITDENSAKILIIADRYHCEDLKEKTINYINKNGLDILATDEFEVMEKNHPHLITQMYQMLFMQRNWN
ncbi:hypothetical protein PV327_009809 [Microctonus hyperodae]|uniref:BTB domain-containing protein n=1 Tax=Microctonus hyperodae TaxID=165561 RepID=A0AA39F1Q8_MICHY|nr:hypothetical protein PV327_009809 [Microctonus hyperodae]